MIFLRMMMMVIMKKRTITCSPLDCCPSGGAGAEHPEGEEDGRDVCQTQRDHQGSILNMQGKLWRPQQAHQGSILRTSDIYVIYSDIKARWQRRPPNSERSSKLNTESDFACKKSYLISKDDSKAQ